MPPVVLDKKLHFGHIPVDEVAGRNADTAAYDRDIPFLAVHAPAGIVGGESSAEGREMEIDDFVVITGAAVRDGPGAFPPDSGVREQSAPEGGQFRRVARMYDYAENLIKTK